MAIGNAAFRGCEALETITIPQSITSIEDNTFAHCSALKAINIPDNITSIGSQAFSMCNSLKEIRFPNSINRIGNLALLGCNSLTSIYCAWETPLECNPDISTAVLNNAVLYVPKGSVSKYREVSPWSKFAHIEEMVSTGVENTIGDKTIDKISIENGVIKVEGISDDIEIIVYDMHGRVVFSGKEKTISNLVHGSYIIKVGNETAKVSI